MGFSSQAHFLTIFTSQYREISLHVSELHKTKLQQLSPLLFSFFLSEQTFDIAVVGKLYGHLLLTNYSGSQHRTQGAFLLVMLI